MPPSGLRISWATPAAISPSDASFSRWMSRCCVSDLLGEVAQHADRADEVAARRRTRSATARCAGNVAPPAPAAGDLPRPARRRPPPRARWRRRRGRRRRRPGDRGSRAARHVDLERGRGAGSPAGLSVTSRPATSAVKMPSSTVCTTEASRRSPRRTSSSLTRSDCCMRWNEATSSVASPVEIVKRSSTMQRAAAPPSEAASSRSKRMRISSSSGTDQSPGRLAPEELAHDALAPPPRRRSGGSAARSRSRTGSRARPARSGPRPPSPRRRRPARGRRRPGACSSDTRRTAPTFRSSDQKTPWAERVEPGERRGARSGGAGPTRTARRRGGAAGSTPCSHQRGQDQRVEPHARSPPRCRRTRPAGCLAASRARRGWPARTGSPRRTTAAPSPRAGAGPRSMRAHRKPSPTTPSMARRV